MTHPDEDKPRARRPAAGARGAFRAMWSMAMMWIDPALVDEDEVPPRFTTGVLLLWTGAGVAVASAVCVGELLVSGESSPLSLVGTLTMFLPLSMAFLAQPPRRLSGLAAASATGLPAGAAVALAGVGPLTPFWSALAGLAVAALVAAAVFSQVARPEPHAPRAPGSPTRNPRG